MKRHYLWCRESSMSRKYILLRYVKNFDFNLLTAKGCGVVTENLDYENTNIRIIL